MFPGRTSRWLWTGSRDMGGWFFTFIRIALSRVTSLWSRGFSTMGSTGTSTRLVFRAAASRLVRAVSGISGIGSSMVAPTRRPTIDEVLQELKLLWHVLVRYGSPATEVDSA